MGTRYNNTCWEETVERYNLFWHHKNFDRPLIQIFARTSHFNELPSCQSLEERWFSPGYFNRLMEHQYQNQKCLAEAFQIAWLNLGPVSGCSLFGVEPVFDDTTSWFEPCLKTPSPPPELSFNFKSGFFKKLLGLYSALHSLDNTKFCPAHVDIGGPADILMTMMGSQSFLEDTVLNRENIIKAVGAVAEKINAYFWELDKFAADKQVFSDWLNLYYPEKGYTIGEDCIVMLDQASVEEIVVPGIKKAIRDIPYPVFHIHSAGIRNLDCFLGIKELRAIEVVVDPNTPSHIETIPCFQKILSSGKGLIIYPSLNELDLLCKKLPSEGLLLSFNTESVADGQNIISKIKYIYHN